MPNKDFQNGLIVGLSSRSVNNITEHTYTLVETITADGTQNSYTVNLTNARDILIAGDYQTATNANLRFQLYNGATEFINIRAGQMSTSAAQRASMEFDGSKGVWLTWRKTPTTIGNGASNMQFSLETLPLPTQPYCDKVIISGDAGVMIPSGSKIYVYAY